MRFWYEFVRFLKALSEVLDCVEYDAHVVVLGGGAEVELADESGRGEHIRLSGIRYKKCMDMQGIYMQGIYIYYIHKHTHALHAQVYSYIRYIHYMHMYIHTLRAYTCNTCMKKYTFTLHYMHARVYSYTTYMHRYTHTLHAWESIKHTTCMQKYTHTLHHDHTYNTYTIYTI